MKIFRNNIIPVNNCEECPFKKKIPDRYNIYYRCKIEDEDIDDFVDNKVKPKWCPLLKKGAFVVVATDISGNLI
jgi:hypothetical protein